MVKKSGSLISLTLRFLSLTQNCWVGICGGKGKLNTHADVLYPCSVDIHLFWKKRRITQPFQCALLVVFRLSCFERAAFLQSCRMSCHKRSMHLQTAKTAHLLIYLGLIEARLLGINVRTSSCLHVNSFDRRTPLLALKPPGVCWNIFYFRHRK